MIKRNYWGVVMLSKILNAAIFASVVSASVAGAQSIAQLGGPSNLPPSGFSGQQFVDNRGCLFLRAGFGATVNWVPRVDKRHMPLCGFPPSFGAAVIAAVEADMAPEPVARVVAVPQNTARVVAAKPVVVAAAAVVEQPVAAPRRGSILALLFGNPHAVQTAGAAPVMVVAQPTYGADLAGPASGQIACWSSAPRLERVLLRTGGTALVCTRGDGTLTGWRPPKFPQGAAVGAALTARQVTPEMMAGATVLGNSRAAVAAVGNAVPVPPRGYKLAWKDDRLNPLRGVGTAEGQAQQDQVWTRDVPAVLVAAQPAPATATVRATRITVSTMSVPAASAASYVQVGTFGEPANAAGVKARLVALGLPVSSAKITRKGKVLQIVYAGPFTSTAAAQAALGLARGAGFGDAILR